MSGHTTLAHDGREIQCVSVAQLRAKRARACRTSAAPPGAFICSVRDSCVSYWYPPLARAPSRVSPRLRQPPRPAHGRGWCSDRAPVSVSRTASGRSCSRCGVDHARPRPSLHRCGHHRRRGGVGDLHAGRHDARIHQRRGRHTRLLHRLQRIVRSLCIPGIGIEAGAVLPVGAVARAIRRAAVNLFGFRGGSHL